MEQRINYDFKGLIECLRDVFVYIQTLQQQRPIATKIQKSRTPSSFSENLAAFLLQENTIQLGRNLATIKLDRKKADIIAIDNDGQEIKIEVKATGINNFQYLSQKDVQSDYIIWLHFGDLFENKATTEIDVYIFQPKLCSMQPQKIDLNRLRKAIQKQLITQRIDLSTFGFC